MHLADGPFSATLTGQILLGSGGLVAAGGVAVGLYRMDYERVPRVALLTSAFFVASLIHLPVPPASVHPVLIGLMGVLLGWAVFPAFLIGLLLQAVFFGHGGFTTLGLNTANFALSGLAGYVLFRHGLRRARTRCALLGLGFAAGAFPVLLAALAVTFELMAIGKAFEDLAKVLLVAHLPVALAEGLLTGYVVVFLHEAKPELLHTPVCMGGEA